MVKQQRGRIYNKRTIVYDASVGFCQYGLNTNSGRNLCRDAYKKMRNE